MKRLSSWLARCGELAMLLAGLVLVLVFLPLIVEEERYEMRRLDDIG